MNTRYPGFAQIARVALPAFFLAQFLVWPIIGLSSPRLGLIAAELLIVWFMALFIRRRRLVAEDLLLLNAVPATTLLLVAPTAMATSLLVAEADLLFSRLLALWDLGMPLSFQRNLLEVQLFHGWSELPLVLVAVALVPGLCEELFFRGFVFTGLYAHRGKRPALVLSALVFALAHFNPWQLPALFLFGLFLGVLVLWTHSVWPAVLAHTLNNLVSVAGVNARAHWGVDFLGPTTHLPPVLLGTALLVFAGGLLLLRRQQPIMPLPERQPALSEPFHPLADAPYLH